MNKFVVFFVSMLVSLTAFSAQEYTVEAEHNDEVFIINGEVFKAKTYCMSLEEGDRVIFLEGSPYGVCVSAKVYDKNSGNVCDLWCE